MGASGVKTFESDTPFDWITIFKEQEYSIRFFEKMFDGVLSEEEYLDADDGEGALAIGEIIAKAKGNGVDDFPLEDFEDFDFGKFNSKLDDSFIEKAVVAIQKVRDFEGSEIRELWEETEEYENWRANVSELIDRIQK